MPTRTGTSVYPKAGLCPGLTESSMHRERAAVHGFWNYALCGLYLNMFNLGFLDNQRRS
jgi:hypothetical protein